MKKNLSLIAAAALMLAFASCNKENVEDTPAEKEKFTFELGASVGKLSQGAVSRTVLNDDWTLSWEKGDVLSLVTEDKEWADGVNFTYDPSSKTFGSADASVSAGSRTFNVLYAPGQTYRHKADGTTHELKSVQALDCSAPTAALKANDALAGQFSAEAPFGQTPQVKMSHLYALMKVTVKNSGAAGKITKFGMKVAEGTNLSGVHEIDFSASPAARYKEGGSNAITLNVAGGDIAAGGELPLYFIVAPLSAYTGDVTFTVTAGGKDYEKTVPVQELTFAPGSYNTTAYTVQLPADEVVIFDGQMRNGLGYSTDGCAGSPAVSDGLLTFRLDNSKNWAAMQIHDTNWKVKLDLSSQINAGYALNFRFKSSLGAVNYGQFSANFQDKYNVGILKYAVVDGEWTKVSIPLSAFGAEDGFWKEITLLKFQYNELSAAQDISFSDIRIGAYEPAPVMSFTLFDGALRNSLVLEMEGNTTGVSVEENLIKWAVPKCSSWATMRFNHSNWGKFDISAQREAGYSLTFRLKEESGADLELASRNVNLMGASGNAGITGLEKYASRDGEWTKVSVPLADFNYSGWKDTQNFKIQYEKVAAAKTLYIDSVEIK